MNKKVIALAVAGALALPLAAKAQTANVTMYGTFRLAMESTDLKNIGRNNHIDSWSSRWGIRGIESLGGGLNGVFQLELGVGLDQPGGATLDGSTLRTQPLLVREGWVGLNGGFGTVKMGTGLTPWDDVMGYGHLLLANGFEGMTTLGAGASPSISRAGNFTSYSSNTSIAGFGNGNNNIGGPSSLNYDARYNNSIRYDSPNFSGLTIATHFAFIGENSTGTKAKGWDTKVDYNNGPITAAIAYSRHIDFATYDGNAWVGHAAYDFGVAKVEGQYQRLKYDGNNGSQGSANVRYYHVGVVVPLGPGWLTAQYHNRNKGVTTSATAVTAINNGGGKAYSMSYKFGFSKRTFVYGFGARVKADGCAAIESIVPAYNATTASCSARPAGSAETATAFGFGVQHNF